MEKKIEPSKVSGDTIELEVKCPTCKKVINIGIGGMLENSQECNCGKGIFNIKIDVEFIKY